MAHPVGKIIQPSAFGPMSGRRYSSFSGRGGIVLTLHAALSYPAVLLNFVTPQSPRITVSGGGRRVEAVGGGRRVVAVGGGRRVNPVGGGR